MADWNAGHLDERAATKAYRALSLDAYVVTMVVALLLAEALHVFGERLGLNTVAAGVAIALYAAISAVALGNLHAHGHRRFGLANVITTVRAAITAMVGGVVMTAGDFHSTADNAALWFLGFVIAFALAMDGVDGYLARRSGTESRFGARFDMEVDALLILFLSCAAFKFDKVGSWVLLIGLMRYAYVIAQAVVPSLRGELPPSLRRKAICVVQGVALCVMLFPIVTPSLSTLLAAAALGTLTYSFAVDVIFLLKRRDHLV